MRYIKFLGVGILFGIVLVKAEIISWYRIQEMFRFQDFHMYGVIGSAVLSGIVIVALIKKMGLRSSEGKEIKFPPKDKSIFRYLYGGTIFGLGWALTGACPGPIYILIGYGFSVFIVVLISALLGTLVYGMVRNKLPQ